jgi:hypothetical protein
VYYKRDKHELAHDPVRNKDVLRMAYESDNAADISYAEYKDMPVKSVKDVLDILGYDIEKELRNKRQLIHNGYIRRRMN